jgi:DNA-directed RNA polymerase subunit omega
MLEDHKFIDSKFRLVILAAKRAKQLVRGAKKKINMHAENPLTVALKEIEGGLINFEIVDEANDQLSLEALEAIGNEPETPETDDLLSLAGDDEDDDYIEENEEEDDEVAEDVEAYDEEEGDFDSDDSEDIDDLEED